MDKINPHVSTNPGSLTDTVSLKGMTVIEPNCLICGSENVKQYEYRRIKPEAVETNAGVVEIDHLVVYYCEKHLPTVSERNKL